MRIQDDGIREYPALCLMTVKFILSKQHWNKADVEVMRQIGFPIVMQCMYKIRQDAIFRRNYLLLKSS